MDCRQVTFSPEKSQQRIDNALQVFPRKLLVRVLAFALHLLGARRKEVAALVEMPEESVKTLLRLVSLDGFAAFYCQTQPLPGGGRWTLRWAERRLQADTSTVGAAPGKSTLHRILQSNQLKPHQSRYFLHIADPDFFPKMEHFLGLYRSPPPNPFFFDECPGIQIFKRCRTFGTGY